MKATVFISLYFLALDIVRMHFNIGLALSANGNEVFRSEVLLALKYHYIIWALALLSLATGVIDISIFATTSRDYCSKHSEFYKCHEVCVNELCFLSIRI